MLRSTIRRATHRDLDALLRIESDSFTDPFPFSFFEEILRSRHYTSLAASHNGGITAYVVAATEQNEGHILSIAVTPSMRRKRIGTALLTALMRQLLAMNISPVYLEVRENNQSGRAFYKRLGFVEKNVIRGYYRDGENAIIMTRKLSKSASFNHETMTLSAAASSVRTSARHRLTYWNRRRMQRSSTPSMLLWS